MGELAKKVIQSMGLKINHEPKARRDSEDVSKREMRNTISTLISETLKEINQNYKSGTIDWAKKNNPQEWEQSLDLEKRINKAALDKDTEALRELLGEYRLVILGLVEEFSSVRE